MRDDSSSGGIAKGTQQRDLSRLIAEKWRAADKEEKAFWNKRANEEAAAHREKYPGAYREEEDQSK